MAPELMTVIWVSVSCVAFCTVILMLVVVLYRKDPLCCGLRVHTTHDYTDDLPHYHSWQSLIGIPHNERSAALNQAMAGPHHPGAVYIIGKPSDYHLDGPLPRLPSYESVRKKDRQRQIHSMIAQRFGLAGCHNEPPPTYEETFSQSLQTSLSVVQPLDIHPSIDDTPRLSEDTRHLSQPSSLQPVTPRHPV
ncbi:unnamed protein product [Menidia menidia]|uniref:(Atlantic silverside) hypothetical protein n=1 Tax=Menidia menidia TaxID=238744 RepID=A0A8S4AYX0_9TELE|nr:unnamed protein product [Menidia menidia]